MRGIIKLENILTTEERLDLLKKAEHYVFKWEDRPGLQSHPDMHKKSEFNIIHQKIINRLHEETGKLLCIDRSWILKTTGKSEESIWHTHGRPFSLVYYIKIPSSYEKSNGTDFEHGFEKVSENGLIFFDGSLKHKPPEYSFSFARYTMGMDLTILNKYP